MSLCGAEAASLQQTKNGNRNTDTQNIQYPYALKHQYGYPYVNTARKTTFYRTQLVPVTLYPVLRWHKAILVPALNLKAPEAIFVLD